MRGRKIIKKFLQITAILLLLVFALPAGAFLLLQSDRIQDKLVNRVMETISGELNTRFTIGRIDIAFLYRVRLSDVYLEDISGDTLLFVKDITVGIRHINPVKKDISIGSINLNEALFSLAIDSARNLNLSYFIEKLRGNGKKEGGWKINFNNLHMRNGRFALRSYYTQPVESGVNYSDMYVYAINTDLKQFNPSPDSVFFLIQSLNFYEKSGFQLENLSAVFSQSRNFLSFRDISIQTPYSRLLGDEISLRFRNWQQFKADSFVRLVKLRVSLDPPSTVNLWDIGYFAQVFRNTDQMVAISGQVRGPVSNLKAKNLELGFGKHSVFHGELNFEGLPDIRSTFIHANIEQLYTSSDDIQLLHLPGDRNVRVPDQLKKLGRISYQGKFTGFIDDFVAFGKFSTDLGILNTDLLIRPDTAKYIDFDGKLTASDFDLGTLLDAQNNVGRISLSVSVNGTTSQGKTVNARLNGLIQRFGFRDYEYTNIALSGDLKDKTFNGSVNIRDPNIELEFLGKVNLSDSVSEYDFTANVTDANLYALHFNKADPDFTASFYLIARGKGKSLNTLNGEIKLLNSLFTKKDKQLQVYDFSILASNESGSDHLRLRSDFMDADLTGDYNLTEINKVFSRFLDYYLPSLADTSALQATTEPNYFNLKAVVKNARPLFDFFLPDYYLADKSNLICTYDSDKRGLNILLNCPQLYVKGMTWNGLVLSVFSNDNLLNLDAGGRNISFGNTVKLENFTVNSSAASDSADFHIRWNNWQEMLSKGDLRALARFSRLPEQKRPQLAIDLLSTTIIAGDSTWTISPGKILIDSTRTELSNIRVSHLDQFVSLRGVLSELPDDRLALDFNRFNLGNLNGPLRSSGFKLGGVLNGQASVSGVYQNPLFTSQMTIDSLMVNNEMLGTSGINCSWDDRRKLVNVEAYTMRDNLKTLDINGTYAPAGEGRFNLELALNKLRLNIFNPYVSRIFSDLKGMASGKATLTGSISRPLLNGQLNLQKSAFTVNYLKTRYNFTEKVQIENNNILFDKVRVFDAKGNSAYLSGAIRNRFLKDFQFDMTIRSDEFLCMNTTQADNKMFYGTAYGTDVLFKITGPPKNLVMDISATTGKNTSIKIPLSNEGKLNEYNFITIVTDDTLDYKEDSETNYQVNLSGLQINFDLTVTPDAEVQIIFDPKLGDIIRGKGSGNLNMKISTNGNFLMYGEYIIEEGDYLFTLQNFINKKFTIEPGGRIRWTGDPFNASIDIVANYQTKASLNDLFGTVDERQTKIAVDDRLTMTGMLMKPDVKYGIYLPNADEETRLKLSNAIRSTEDLNKQFISLLLQNRFIPSNTIGQGSTGSGSSTYSNAAGVNASEFLSNQLSHWLSQISNDVDVGINYRSNRAMKSDEVQVALSTQLFNDRLTINGSVDVATNAAVYATDNIVGEFDIDYKITKNGKFRIKTFNHVNNEMLYENAPYTQGLGVFYKEEFNSVGELWRHYWRSITGNSEKEPRLEIEEEAGEGG